MNSWNFFLLLLLICSGLLLFFIPSGLADQDPMHVEIIKKADDFYIIEFNDIYISRVEIITDPSEPSDDLVFRIFIKDNKNFNTRNRLYIKDNIKAIFEQKAKAFCDTIVCEKITKYIYKYTINPANGHQIIRELRKPNDPDPLKIALRLKATYKKEKTVTALKPDFPIFHVEMTHGFEPQNFNSKKESIFKELIDYLFKDHLKPVSYEKTDDNTGLLLKGSVSTTTGELKTAFRQNFFRRFFKVTSSNSKKISLSFKDISFQLDTESQILKQANVNYWISQTPRLGTYRFPHNEGSDLNRLVALIADRFDFKTGRPQKCFFQSDRKKFLFSIDPEMIQTESNTDVLQVKLDHEMITIDFSDESDCYDFRNYLLDKDDDCWNSNGRLETTYKFFPQKNKDGTYFFLTDSMRFVLTPVNEKNLTRFSYNGKWYFFRVNKKAFKQDFFKEPVLFDEISNGSKSIFAPNEERAKNIIRQHMKADYKNLHITYDDTHGLSVSKDYKFYYLDPKEEIKKDINEEKLKSILFPNKNYWDVTSEECYAKLQKSDPKEIFKKYNITYNHDDIVDLVNRKEVRFQYTPITIHLTDKVKPMIRDLLLDLDLKNFDVVKIGDIMDLVRKNETPSVLFIEEIGTKDDLLKKMKFSEDFVCRALSDKEFEFEVLPEVIDYTVVLKFFQKPFNPGKPVTPEPVCLPEEMQLSNGTGMTIPYGFAPDEKLYILSRNYPRKVPLDEKKPFLNIVSKDSNYDILFQSQELKGEEIRMNYGLRFSKIKKLIIYYPLSYSASYRSILKSRTSREKTEDVMIALDKDLRAFIKKIRREEVFDRIYVKYSTDTAIDATGNNAWNSEYLFRSESDYKDFIWSPEVVLDGYEKQIKESTDFVHIIIFTKEEYPKKLIARYQGFENAKLLVFNFFRANKGFIKQYNKYVAEHPIDGDKLQIHNYYSKEFIQDPGKTLDQNQIYEFVMK